MLSKEVIRMLTNNYLSLSVSVCPHHSVKYFTYCMSINGS